MLDLHSVRRPVPSMYAPCCEMFRKEEEDEVGIRLPGPIRGWKAIEYFRDVDDVHFGILRKVVTRWSSLTEAKEDIEENWDVTKWTGTGPYRVCPRAALKSELIRRRVARKLWETEPEFRSFIALWIRDHWCPGPMADWLRDRDHNSLADCAQWAFSAERRILNCDPMVVGRVFPQMGYVVCGWNSLAASNTRRADGPRSPNEIWTHNLPQDVYVMADRLHETDWKGYSDETALLLLLDGWACARPS